MDRAFPPRPDPRARSRVSRPRPHASPASTTRAIDGNETQKIHTRASPILPNASLPRARPSHPSSRDRATARIGRASVRAVAIVIRSESERASPSPHRAFDRIDSHAPIDALGLRRRRRHARARVRNRRERDRAHVVERRRSVPVGEGWWMARVCREGDSMTSRDPSCPRVVCFSW